MQPQGHHKQESTTFILPYGSSKQYCMDKEEFHWVFGVVQGWFSAKLGSKISRNGSQLLSAQFPLPLMQPHRHNKQESTTFILPYGFSKQHCMGKEEFHWFFGVVQGWFSAKLGLGSKTALYGQGRVSLVLWCCAGLVFSKTWTWVKNQQ
jgi:hypothetical protein